MAPAAPSPAAVIAKRLGSQLEAGHFAFGCCTLCTLVYVTGAAPSLLPLVYVIFIAAALPWRIHNFISRKWAPFLIDFCYFVNFATVYYVMRSPQHPSPQAEAVLYVLTEGPLAGALVVWRCAWVLGSPDHVVSVMLHLLPGLALFARRYAPPITLDSLRIRTLVADFLSATGSPTSQPTLDAPPPHRPNYVDSAALWLVFAPVVLYCCWQFVYWLLVQILFRAAIRRHGCDTSYNALARRARAGNGVGNGSLEAWVCSGSIAQRITNFGLLQLSYTIGTILLVIPTYYCYPLAVLWQVAKFVVPLWYGAQYQCGKLPGVAFLAGLEKLSAQGLVPRTVLEGQVTVQAPLPKSE